MGVRADFLATKSLKNVGTETTNDRELEAQHRKKAAGGLVRPLCLEPLFPSSFFNSICFNAVKPIVLIFEPNRPPPG